MSFIPIHWKKNKQKTAKGGGGDFVFSKIKVVMNTMLTNDRF